MWLGGLGDLEDTPPLAAAGEWRPELLRAGMWLIVLRRVGSHVLVVVTLDGDKYEEDLSGADAGARPRMAHLLVALPLEPDNKVTASTAEELREYLVAVASHGFTSGFWAVLRGVCVCVQNGFTVHVAMTVSKTDDEGGSKCMPNCALMTLTRQALAVSTVNTRPENYTTLCLSDYITSE